MRIKYFIVIIQLVLFWNSGICQKSADKDDHETVKDDSKYSPGNLDLSRFQINDVKTRGVIVRLKTNKDRIAAYRKVGNTKVADRMEKRAQTLNLNLIYAFITEWTYSPVYFMESQNTSKLLRDDTLIAKTFDLKRDTAIYMNHDSFYIVDFGEELMQNERDGDHPIKYTNVSTTNPVNGEYWVVKDHNQKQLQPPMPCNAKVWLEEFTNIKKINSIEIPEYLNDSMKVYFDRYKTTHELLKSVDNVNAKKFMDSVYYHITFESRQVSMGSGFLTPSIIGFGIAGFTLVLVKGNPLQNGVKRLNKSFIAYYCKRLDKDRNILCPDDLYYWWQRNPNLPYLPYLRDIEVELKFSTNTDVEFIKMH